MIFLTRALRSALLTLALVVAPAALALTGVVNVNTATQAELELLPGIGASKARAILTARDANGGFATVEELRDVRGIGDAALERIRPHVVVRGKTTALAD